MGVTNYYSGYCPHYAKLAATLTSKLSVKRVDGKKGSTKRVTWKDGEIKAFQKLLEGLVLFQDDPDKPFILGGDASDRAIGAVIEQKRERALTPHGTVTLALFSRNHGKIQLNWTPGEKETYAVVEALKNGPDGLAFSPFLSPRNTSPRRTGSMKRWPPRKVLPVVGPDDTRTCQNLT
jgi:hypothetical protein